MPEGTPVAHPTIVIIAGVGGGLDPSLASGALILGRRVLAEGRPELTPHPALFAAARSALQAGGIGFVSSQLLTAARPPATAAAKRDAWNTFGAAGVDMETYELAAALESAGVPWLALRSVLDTAASTLPAAVARWSAESDERQIARAALRTPRDWPAYLRLALELRASLRGLRRGVPVLRAAFASIESLPAARSPRPGAVDVPLVGIR
ncbi:MAG: hypothetical protein IVW36_11440 [Dehalococcoidia bacterium]|nr:hypothetical protein [Dehalococcoidia bacterium]